MANWVHRTSPKLMALAMGPEVKTCKMNRKKVTEITWPTRSLDLTPPDFMLWGIVKVQVYRTPVRDLADLQERIYAYVNKVGSQNVHHVRLISIIKEIAVTSELI